MPRQFKPNRRDLNLERMFETRSDAWERVGLSIDVDERESQRARRDALILAPLLIAVIVAYDWVSHNGWKPLGTGWPSHLKTPITIVAAVAVLAIGWALARAIGKSAGPTFMRRMDPATAGTAGFLIRLATMAIAVIAALSVAGVTSQTLAVGGAFTAVIFGLAAQQTLGNVFAGMVLISARSFRVGDRVRFQAGALGGAIEGIVSSLGLLYTTLTRGADQIMIPNNQVLAAVVVPLTEPDSVDVKVRLTSGVRPSHVQAILDQEISVPTRNGASVNLEEVDGDDVVVRVKATPDMSHDGAKLADEIMVALASVTGEHEAQDQDGNGADTREPRRIRT
jgi:small-conductance mechanosensitive channel